jgi:cell division septum initiation protein DivIVA
MVSMRQTGPMKTATASRIRRTAEVVDHHHPETVTGGHLRDAARMLGYGHTDAAKRHLDAAMEVLTPRNLIRHGITDDEGHATAKQHMHEIHRMRLQVQDIEDVRARNDDLRERARQAAAARVGGPGRGAVGATDTGTRPGSPPPAVRAFSNWGEVVRAIELAFPAMAWEHEARDPHTGKWSAGPATLGNIRTHLENAHGFGHSFPDQSNEHLLARHARLHRDLPMAQNHHHVVTGGGADSAYGRMRAARDTRAALSAPALTPGEKGRMGITGPERVARGRVKGAPHSMGYSSWEEISQAIELSARTAMLERTPAPRGRPGGPGLYHVQGLGHTPYLQQVVKALIEKRGMAPDKAYAVARGAIRKWARGGGHVHPEVVAAAGKAEAGEVARQARAHAHTADPAGRVIELFNPNHAPTGQFTTAQGAGQGQGKRKPGAGKGMAGKTAGSRARLVQRAKLQKRASGIRSQIHALLSQLPHHQGKSKSSTPAKKGAAATSAKQAAASKKAAASSTAKRASSATAHKTLSPATIHAKINALRAELRAIEAQIRAL